MHPAAAAALREPAVCLQARDVPSGDRDADADAMPDRPIRTPTVSRDAYPYPDPYPDADLVSYRHPDANSGLYAVPGDPNTDLPSLPGLSDGRPNASQSRNHAGASRIYPWRGRLRLRVSGGSRDPVGWIGRARILDGQGSLSAT